ncbi:MAG: esterase-like activity of phytase family protein [Acidobacteriota bacterium]|nr:esterase-like activity of phytase family protein [Acidobacteriota bacterium]
MIPSLRRALAGACLLLPLAGCVGLNRQISTAAGQADHPFASVRHLTFLGEAEIESGFTFAGTVVGGLSALTFDPRENLYYALADDPSLLAPARIYGLRIDLSDGRLTSGDVSIQSMVVLRDTDGEPFEEYELDGEGLATSTTGGFFFSSEGNIERGIQPFLREITSDGSTGRSLELPKRYLSRRDGRRGVRHNLAFEALTLTPSGRWLVVGTENALADDGPPSDLDVRSPSRLLRYDVHSGRSVAEYLYWVEPVSRPPSTPDGFKVNGLVELLALDDDHFLALEREFSHGVGNSIRLYGVDLTEADNILGHRIGRRAARIRPAAKTLLLDLAELGIPLDNIEALAFGPELPDGRRTLLLASDNNFSLRQRSQFLAFAWSDGAIAISQIQGADHRSPLAGDWVFGVEGIVTAIERNAKPARAWLQGLHGDDDPKTSEALSFAPLRPAEFAPGDVLSISGQVSESGRDGSLSVTRIENASAWILSRGEALPAPIQLGPAIPRLLDDDGFTAFEPENDAIDHLESLEGMRVSVPAPVAVGPTTRFGDFVVLAERGGENGPRTARGGILLTAEDSQSARVQVDPRLLRPGDRRQNGKEAPGASGIRVGTTFEEEIVGVLDYSFGAFEVVASEPLPPSTTDAESQERTTLRGDDQHLTLATFNVENLDARDSSDKFDAVARTIVDALGAPDVVALQEVQDDNGPVDDGVVSAAKTLERLVATITAMGGPRYEFHQIDPANNSDGGQPGANIRVAYLVDRQRVDVPAHGGTADAPSLALLRRDDGLHLAANPIRIGADDPAFSFDQDRGYEASRKPLALEIEYAAHRLFLINTHLKSKRGDDGLFGSRQPPQRHSERQRLAQARVIRRFVEDILATDTDALVVVLGDLNDHEFRAPVSELAGDVLVNLIADVEPARRYTYNYRGASQVLDHVLVSSSVAGTTSPAIDIVHVNADEPESARSSDHDPVVVRFELAD